MKKFLTIIWFASIIVSSHLAQASTDATQSVQKTEMIQEGNFKLHCYQVDLVCQRAVFATCLDKIKSPSKTDFNDMDETVEACEGSAKRMCEHLVCREEY